MVVTDATGIVGFQTACGHFSGVSQCNRVGHCGGSGIDMTGGSALEQGSWLALLLVSALLLARPS